MLARLSAGSTVVLSFFFVYAHYLIFFFLSWAPQVNKSCLWISLSRNDLIKGLFSKIEFKHLYMNFGLSFITSDTENILQIAGHGTK